MTSHRICAGLSICASLLAACAGRNAGAAAAPMAPPAGSKYYKVHPYFIPFPGEKDRSNWVVRRFGPVGIGIELTRPAFGMKVSHVEKGSPAEATGKLKKGQVIESINGKTLRDIDPRVILADIITEAEATDGKVVFKIKDEGQVTVKIPVLGRYSKTWPLNCRKSDKIVRNLADLMAGRPGTGFGKTLFLLSTGEEKDLEVVRNWFRDSKGPNAYPWYIGLNGPA